MKNFTKPVLAAATIAALAGGLAVAQGGVANAADAPTASDCAVAVTLPTTPIVETGASVTFPVTTTWTGTCLTEKPTATASFDYYSAPTNEATAVSTALTGLTFTSLPLSAKTGTTSVTIATASLPAAGSYIQLKANVANSTTTKDNATATPAVVGTVITPTSNQTQVKSGSIADIKYSREGKSVVFVGHAYTYVAGVKTAQATSSVRLQKLVGTEYQTVATTTTSSTGRYQFSYADATASVYRVATAGTTAIAENYSPSLTSTVPTVADTKVIRLSTSKVAKKVTIKGTLFVRSSVTGNFKATTGVAAELQKKLNGSWVNVKKVRSTTSGSISAVANNVHKTAYRFVVIQNSSYKTSTSTSISR